MSADPPRCNLLAISVGRIAPLFADQPEIKSAIRKTPVSTPEHAALIAVDRLGVAGDAQADRRVHGGPRMAVYLYPHEHYPVWQTMREQAVKVAEPLPPGFMGENLTICGLLESDVWIGDRLHIGPTGANQRGVVLAVTEPRTPCFKFNAVMGFKHAAKMMVQSGYTGWYCAVLQTGQIAAGDAIRVVAGERLVRIDEKHRLINRKGQEDLF